MKQDTASCLAVAIFVKREAVFTARGPTENRSVPTKFSGILENIQQILNSTLHHMMDVNIHNH